MHAVGQITTHPYVLQKQCAGVATQVGRHCGTGRVVRIDINRLRHVTGLVCQRPQGDIDGRRFFLDGAHCPQCPHHRWHGWTQFDLPEASSDLLAVQQAHCVVQQHRVDLTALQPHRRALDPDGRDGPQWRTSGKSQRQMPQVLRDLVAEIGAYLVVAGQHKQPAGVRRASLTLQGHTPARQAQIIGVEIGALENLRLPTVDAVHARSC